MEDQNKAKTQEFIGLAQAAMMLDISMYTLNNWYKWYGSELNKTSLKLPEIIRASGSHSKRFIKASDLPMLEEFKKNLKRGDMAEFNAAFLWGKRGEAILEKRGSSSKKDIKKIWRDSKIHHNSI